MTTARTITTPQSAEIEQQPSNWISRVKTGLVRLTSAGFVVLP
jgi:hypothetical protein